jgi:hypothetical protein
MNWNKYNFKIGDRVVLDKKYNNSSEVLVIGFTTNNMFATVQSDDGDKWQTMTTRLTPILSNETFKSE